MRLQKGRILYLEDQLLLLFNKFNCIGFAVTECSFDHINTALKIGNIQAYHTGTRLQLYRGLLNDLTFH